MVTVTLWLNSPLSVLRRGAASVTVTDLGLRAYLKRDIDAVRLRYIDRKALPDERS